MVITKSILAPACAINTGKSGIDYVDKFKYVGAIITGNGRCEQKIRSRISQSKQVFYRLTNIQTNKNLSFQVRECVLQCYVYSILTYGYKTWVLSNVVEKRIQVAEMCFFSKNVEDSVDNQTY